jgi:transcriptional regulator with XRE-family HTH domain
MAQRGRKPNLERQRQAVALRAEGLTLRQIGGRLGVTHQRVSQLLGPCRSPAPRLRCPRCRARLSPAAGEARVALLCPACLAALPRETFAQRLRACRLAAGLTQVALARRIGVNDRTLAYWENEYHRPHPEALRRLAAVLGAGLLGGGAQGR